MKEATDPYLTAHCKLKVKHGRSRLLGPVRDTSGADRPAAPVHLATDCSQKGDDAVAELHGKQ